jgi:5-methylcytosine-specific restriction endonuclease McrA
MIPDEQKQKIFLRRWENLKISSIGLGLEIDNNLKHKLEEKFINTHQCEYCGNEFDQNKKGFEPSIDHMKPKSKGVTNEIQNLAIVCFSCNLIKGTMSAETFCEIIDLIQRYGKNDLLTRWKNESKTSSIARRLQE